MSTAEAASTSTREGELSEAGLEAWKTFLRAHTGLMAALEEELRAHHGYAVGDLDVLAQLAEAPKSRLRMCDLAAAVVLSPSGLSRRVDRLQRAGLISRERDEQDARTVQAHLTPAGRRLLRRLRITHRQGVKERFADRFSPQELATLNELLGRLAPRDD